MAYRDKSNSGGGATSDAFTNSPVSLPIARSKTCRRLSESFGHSGAGFYPSGCDSCDARRMIYSDYLTDVFIPQIKQFDKIFSETVFPPFADPEAQANK